MKNSSQSSVASSSHRQHDRSSRNKNTAASATTKSFMKKGTQAANKFDKQDDEEESGHSKRSSENNPQSARSSIASSSIQNNLERQATETKRFFLFEWFSCCSASPANNNQSLQLQISAAEQNSPEYDANTHYMKEKGVGSPGYTSENHPTHQDGQQAVNASIKQHSLKSVKDQQSKVEVNAPAQAQNPPGAMMKLRIKPKMTMRTKAIQDREDAEKYVDDMMKAFFCFEEKKGEDGVQRQDSKVQIPKVSARKHESILLAGQSSNANQDQTQSQIQQRNQQSISIDAVLPKDNNKSARKSVRIAIDPKAARLQLKVEDGDEALLKPKILFFNEVGLENAHSLRNAQDGSTHFGIKKIRDDGKSKVLLNDFVFEPTDPSHLQFFGDRHFSISFKKDINKYVLQDSGIGSGTFLKVIRPHRLQSGELFSIGKDLNFIVVFDKKEEQKVQLGSQSKLNQAQVQNMFNENQEYRPSDANNSSHDRMKISGARGQDGAIGGLQPLSQANTVSINFIENLLSKQHDSCSLMSQATVKRTHHFTREDTPIIIGRTQDCKVRFKEGALSRMQCALEFKQDQVSGQEGWLLTDGNGKDKQSTNGTWLWVSQPQVLEDGDLFKAGNAIFKVNYLPPLIIQQ